MTARRCARRAIVGAVLGLLVALPWVAKPSWADHGTTDEPRVATSRYVPPQGLDGGLLSLPAHADAEGALSAVVLLGDGGADGRVQFYALRLLSLGFAVLEVDDDGTGWSDSSDTAPDEVPAERRLAASLAALHGVTQIAPAAVGVIGIGSGAHALLEGSAGWRSMVAAAVLIYPACEKALASVPPEPSLDNAPPRPRLLLVHGDADPAAAAACASLAAALGGAEAGVQRYVLHGAGFGWDVSGIGSASALMLPDPARSGSRWRAVPDRQRALIALDQILLFLGSTLDRRTATQ
ncbi:dienelactone hydrolase family protein [Falsiroseomonas oryziterrae]|uniref:hypothetical protein n=1 Tax=Falsiroseomonas oryziterrae TaxID=2911368 RepID=UPI001F2927F0|nr:hypothetical protein [Roseomonas sp. NPKOSM-4]